MYIYFSLVYCLLVELHVAASSASLSKFGTVWVDFYWIKSNYPRVLLQIDSDWLFWSVLDCVIFAEMYSYWIQVGSGPVPDRLFNSPPPPLTRGFYGPTWCLRVFGMTGFWIRFWTTGRGLDQFCLSSGSFWITSLFFWKLSFIFRMRSTFLNPLRLPHVLH